MIGCLWTLVRKQPIIALYFEFETVLKFHNLEASATEHMIWLRNKKINFYYTLLTKGLLNKFT